MTPHSAAINRIERAYRVTSQDGRVVEALTTSEDVRPFTPQALVGAVRAAGFSVREAVWDCRPTRTAATDGRFFAVVAER